MSETHTHTHTQLSQKIRKWKWNRPVTDQAEGSERSSQTATMMKSKMKWSDNIFGLEIFPTKNGPFMGDVEIFMEFMEFCGIYFSFEISQCFQQKPQNILAFKMENSGKPKTQTEALLLFCQNRKITVNSSLPQF